MSVFICDKDTLAVFVKCLPGFYGSHKVNLQNLSLLRVSRCSRRVHLIFIIIIIVIGSDALSTKNCKLQSCLFCYI